MRSIASLVPTVSQGAPVVHPLAAARTASGALVPLRPAEAQAVIEQPPSALLAAAMQAIDGPLVRIERPAPTPGAPPLVSYAAPRMPADAEDALPEAQARLVALRIVLAPASLELRLKWASMFAAAVERSPEGEDLDNGVKLLAGLLDLPAICFRAVLPRQDGEEAKDWVFRCTIERVREVARKLHWWSSFAKVEPALAEYAVDMRAEERRLAELVRRLTKPAQAALPAPQEPEEDPAAYLARLEADAAAGRPHTAALARTFRRSLAPELAERFADRLARLCSPPDASTDQARAQARRTLNPNGTMARLLAEENAKLHAGAAAAPKAPASSISDDELRRLVAERAALVDLSDEQAKPSPRPVSAS
ncbi:conserved protein of unknown function (plasmid) [Rhodovastum atsumiense]|uniref:Uncharacterized protein n=1 Tax=Rhodovastum atsumiense TaxID=504468 RepID=A0A5M6IUL6_9PROT|nr:hypothetical protein [Rhodovastum atsumiense]KAA5611557.1 hypothetical protein F1189_13410 [Rhodovastum atsumiense]CAH2606214.1 conserved protein of unknown function [Rhodovastum atsumiense]